MTCTLPLPSKSVLGRKCQELDLELKSVKASSTLDSNLRDIVLFE